MALAYACFSATDWLLLASSPRLPLLGSGHALAPGLACLMPVLLDPQASGAEYGLLADAAIALNLALTSRRLRDLVEPFRITTTQRTLTHAGLEMRIADPGAPHLGYHFEGQSPREERLIEHVPDAPTDLIFLTGDYLASRRSMTLGHRRSTPPSGTPGGRCGVYAVTGGPPVDVLQRRAWHL